MTIRDKLKRFNSARLTQIQDIGGCRAVLQTLDDVIKLAKCYTDEDAGKPEKERGKLTDYIKKPRASGYRGIHMVYKYYGEQQVFDGLSIELQFRSANQHAWATAVETVGTFTQTALKSSKGSGDWLRFFAVMATAIAEIEGCARVPNTPPPQEVRQMLIDYIGELDALGTLRTLGQAIHVTKNYDLKNDRFVLLKLSPGSRDLEVWGYRKEQIQKAYDDYAAIEKEIRGGNEMAVLVTVSAISELRRAYPNYFLDTSAFVDLVEKAVG